MKRFLPPRSGSLGGIHETRQKKMKLWGWISRWRPVDRREGPAARRQKAFHETTYGPGAETSGFNLFDF